MMIIDPAIVAVAAASESERTMAALQRDPTIREIRRGDAALHRAYSTVRTTAAGIAALADAVLRIEDVEPVVARAIRSIREAANQLQGYAQVGIKTNFQESA